MPTTTATQNDLVAAVVAAFALTADDITGMADEIAQARKDAATAAIQAAVATVGAELDDDWVLPSALGQRLEEAAQQAAEGIAATYQEDLQRQAEAEVEACQGEDETLCRVLVVAALATWALTRRSWKAGQIALAETSAGADAGTDTAIADLLSGDLEPGNDLPLEEIEVAVLPDEAEEEFCAAFAGWSFALAQYQDLPTFPAHPGCDHHKVIILA